MLEIPNRVRKLDRALWGLIDKQPGAAVYMRAICAKCGQAASVTSTPNGFSYTPEDGAMLHCPVVKERMEKEGGTSNTDCDHMQEVVQSLADRLRGTSSAAPS